MHDKTHFGWSKNTVREACQQESRAIVSTSITWVARCTAAITSLLTMWDRAFQPWSEQMIWQKSGLSAFWTFPPRWMSVCLLTWWLMKCKFSSDLRGHFLPHPKALYPSVNLVPVIFTMCLLGTVAIQGRCTGNLALCHYCQKPAVATSALWRKKGFFCSVVFCKLVKNCCFLALISVLQMVTALLLGFLCAKNIPAQLPLQQHVCASPMEVTGHNCFTSLNFLTF